MDPADIVVFIKGTSLVWRLIQTEQVLMGYLSDGVRHAEPS
jgi:hypothetical protein